MSRDGSTRVGLTLRVERWSGDEVRFCSVLVLFVLVGCSMDQPAGTCELRIEAPVTVTAPVGSSTDFTVRFFNPTVKPVKVSALSTALPFSFRNGSGDFTIGSGTCDAPGEVGLVMGFSPATFGVRRAPLTVLIDGAPRTIDLSAMATGPLLTVTSVVTFGATGLLPSRSRVLALRNVGTEGTSLEVDVVAVSSTNATTSPSELCVGSVEFDACQPVSRVTVRRDASIPLVVLPTSVGPKSWNVELRAGDTTWATRVSATVVDTRDCQLSADPPLIGFGFVPAGRRVTRSTTLRNGGATSCVVTAARTNDARFEVVSAQRTIPAGTAQVVTVDALENTSQSVSMLTFDLAPSVPGQDTTLDVRLVTAIPPPCLVVQPADVDFGVTRPDCGPRERAVSVYNTCREPLVVRSMSAEPPFSVIRGLPVEGLTLPQGQVATVTVQYTPGANIGRVSGALRIDYGLGLTEFVGLSGRAEPSGLMTDTFAFDARLLNDIVIILDDSPSFVRQHPNTRAELDRLAASLSATRDVANSRVAFTTTDVSLTGPQGRFRSTDGGSRWASADDPSFLSTFAALSTLSSSGAEHQSCIEAAARAVTEPLSSDARGNAGFSRQNALLSLLCVTDDVENAADPAGWRRALEGLDAGSRLNYSVVGPFGSACPVDALDVSGSHLGSIRALNGVASDVCRPWEIYSLGGPSPQRTRFTLNGTPRIGTLVVTVNGAVLPPQSGGQTNWTYDSATNSIVFAPSVLGLDPPPVTVSYQVACPQ